MQPDIVSSAFADVVVALLGPQVFQAVQTVGPVGFALAIGGFFLLTAGNGGDHVHAGRELLQLEATVVDPRKLRLPPPGEVAVDDEEYALGVACLAVPFITAAGAGYLWHTTDQRFRVGLVPDPPVHRPPDDFTGSQQQPPATTSCFTSSPATAPSAPSAP